MNGVVNLPSQSNFLSLPGLSFPTEESSVSHPLTRKIFSVLQLVSHCSRRSLSQSTGRIFFFFSLLYRREICHRWISSFFFAVTSLDVFYVTWILADSNEFILLTRLNRAELLLDANPSQGKYTVYYPIIRLNKQCNLWNITQLMIINFG